MHIRQIDTHYKTYWLKLNDKTSIANMLVMVRRLESVHSDLVRPPNLTRALGKGYCLISVLMRCLSTQLINIDQQLLIVVLMK